MKFKKININTLYLYWPTSYPDIQNHHMNSYQYHGYHCDTPRELLHKHYIYDNNSFLFHLKGEGDSLYLYNSTTI